LAAVGENGKAREFADESLSRRCGDWQGVGVRRRKPQARPRHSF